eukprot:SAG31_NODE_6775_length_1892_cov_21.724484_2_plen_43_part_00
MLEIGSSHSREDLVYHASGCSALKMGSGGWEKNKDAREVVPL